MLMVLPEKATVATIMSPEKWELTTIMLTKITVKKFW